MAQVHIDEEVATLIAEALHARWTYPKVQQKGFAKNANQIALVVKEMEAGKIIIDQEGRAVVGEWDVVKHKEINQDPITGKKKENKLSTDKEFITKVAGLDPSEKVRKETGTEDSSKIMEAQTKFLSTQLQVAQAIGIFTVNMIREKAELTEEQLNDPELQTKRLIEYLKGSKILTQDPRALDRITAEYAYMKTAVQKGDHLLGVMQAAFDIASRVMCDDCRRQTFYALSLQAKGPPRPEFAEGMSSKDKPTEATK